MVKKILTISFILVVAFGILLVSVLRTASVRYTFSQRSPVFSGPQVLGQETQIDYILPYPGKILPDHPLWFIKALRDRFWLLVTTNPTRKAELNLLFADKRLVMSKMLFEKEKPSLAYATLTKAEKYLEKASDLERKNRQEKGIDTTEFLVVLAKASLKHREVINEMLVIAPEDAKPEIIKTRDYSIRVFNEARNALQEKGVTPPENPFETP